MPGPSADWESRSIPVGNTMALAFAGLNLLRNPFGELDAEDRLRAGVVELGDLPGFLRRGRTAVQFLGEHGRGKTTHLLALSAHFPAAPFFKVLAGDRSPRGAWETGFVDSLDCLAPGDRGRTCRQFGSLAFTSHADLAQSLTGEGFSVRTVRVGQADPDRIERILNRRIELARRGPGALPRIGSDCVRELIGLYGDDIRAMEDRLYERFQEMKGTGHVQL
jgi:hypothetical protein